MSTIFFFNFSLYISYCCIMKKLYGVVVQRYDVLQDFS